MGVPEATGKDPITKGPPIAQGDLQGHGKFSYKSKASVGEKFPQSLSFDPGVLEGILGSVKLHIWGKGSRRVKGKCLHSVGLRRTSGIPWSFLESLLPWVPRGSGMRGPGSSMAPGTTGRCSPFPLPPRSDAAERGSPGPGPPAGPAAQRHGGRHPHGPHLNPTPNKVPFNNARLP